MRRIRWLLLAVPAVAALGLAAWWAAEPAWSPRPLAAEAQDLGLASARGPVPKLVVSGPARVVDGDTLDVTGVRVRIFGIDAMEKAQVCERDRRRYPCGEAATRWLETTIAGRPVSCAQRDRDHFRRMVGVCRVDRIDLGEGSVRAGWAIAYTRFSEAYLEAEDEAKRHRRGVWAGRHDDPRSWR